MAGPHHPGPAIGSRGGNMMEAKPITLLPRIFLPGARGRILPHWWRKLERSNFTYWWLSRQVEAILRKTKKKKRLADIAEKAERWREKENLSFSLSGCLSILSIVWLLEPKNHHHLCPRWVQSRWVSVICKQEYLTTSSPYLAFTRHILYTRH